jgi:large subunit ribosomal protein L9
MAKTKSKKPKPGRTQVDERRFPKKIKRRRQMIRGKHGGMQLMLVEDVPHVGKRGDVVEVKPGYGRNYLLPQGLATFATPEALKRIEAYKAKVEAIRIARLNDLKMLAKKLEEHSVTIEANANEEGHLYGSVTEVDVARSLKSGGFAVEPAQIKLEGHLKELGLYSIRVALEEEIEAELRVWVVPAQEAK